MNHIQFLRRLSQQSFGGWELSYKELKSQLILISKLYAKYNLEIVNTCGACPEQYDIFKDGKQVAYYRLRHGEFRVDIPECGGETIYNDEPFGDGTFYSSERLVYLTKAMRAVLVKIDTKK